MCYYTSCNNANGGKTLMAEKRQCFSQALPAIWAGQASKSFTRKKISLT